MPIFSKRLIIAAVALLTLIAAIACSQTTVEDRVLTDDIEITPLEKAGTYIQRQKSEEHDNANGQDIWREPNP